MIPMPDPTDDQIVHTMVLFGGSFVRALANAYRCGDPVNQARIKATWPEYWREYADLATLHAQRRAEAEP